MTALEEKMLNEDIINHFNELKSKVDVNKDKVIVRYNRMVRNGVAIQKGATLNKNRINKKLALYEIYCTFFSVYPDLYLDLIKPQNSGFNFFFYQRIFLRACLRYRLVYTTAPRALIEE